MGEEVQERFTIDCKLVDPTTLSCFPREKVIPLAGGRELDLDDEMP